MTDDAISELRAALQAHKDQIEKAHAESLAAQVLLVGLMNALIKRGFDRVAIDEVFEFAAQVAMAATDKSNSTQPTWSLHVIDNLRKSIG